MLSTKRAFISFSVNDIQKAKEFYGTPSPITNGLPSRF